MINNVSIHNKLIATDSKKIIDKYRAGVRAEVNKISNNNEVVAGFIMTNLIFNEFNMEYEHKSNLHALSDAYENLISFDVSDTDNMFEKRVVVVGSNKSKYILEHDIKGYEDKFRRFSRERDLIMLDCHHWVHFEKFEETLNHLLKLYNE
jgi:hypothetical protein